MRPPRISGEITPFKQKFLEKNKKKSKNYSDDLFLSVRILQNYAIF